LLETDLWYCWNQPNPVPPKVCVWRAAPNCVPHWTYKGESYSICSKKNHDRAWCSYDAVYNNKWDNCVMSCQDEGQAQGCYWEKTADCATTFTYRGKDYSGCTKVNHNSGWCSLDSQFKGKWQSCLWTCPSPLLTIVPTTSTPRYDDSVSNLARKISQEPMPPQAYPRNAAATAPAPTAAITVSRKPAGAQSGAVAIDAATLAGAMSTRQRSTASTAGQSEAAQLRARARPGSDLGNAGNAPTALMTVLGVIACLVCGLIMSVLSFLLARLQTKRRVSPYAGLQSATQEDELPLMPTN